MLAALQNVRCVAASSVSASSPPPSRQFRAAASRVSCLAPSQITTAISTDDDDYGYSGTSAAGGDSGVDGGGGSGIHVPRQSFISVSKSSLLDAIIAAKFSLREGEEEDAEEVRQFLQLSRCLDSILHAEHKTTLEEMRADYDLTISSMGKAFTPDVFPSLGLNYIPNDKSSSIYKNSTPKSDSIDEKHEDETEFKMSLSSKFTVNLRQFLGSSLKTIQGIIPVKKSRDVTPVRFQRAIVKLLCNAEFQELSLRDLMLASALNTNYLLTLPIHVDWKRASESSAIIFRRGYATERQKGLLIAEKFDYLQSKLIQNFVFLIAKPLGRFGVWLNEVFESFMQPKDTEVLINKLELWFKNFPVSLQPNSSNDESLDDLNGDGTLSNELPIWEAAQKAVSRYEQILSAVGPRERLLRKFLILIGLVPAKPKQVIDVDPKRTCSERNLSQSFLPRITLSDIWKPASLKICGNDFWKMLRTSASILTSESILQEPAFQQLILLYTEENGERETVNKAETPLLQMKIYERIPIPDLPVVFPHKKLSFRVIDSVRLDVATILGLLAYFLSYKFEDILSSPSALLLDVIAASALVIYVTRVLLGYKQTRDRYQLLVNKTLYEKTVASGFGCIHFLLDASEEQQFKEAILVYAILLKGFKAAGGQVTGFQYIADKCERLVYNAFQEKVEMPVDKAIKTLVRLGLVNSRVIDEQNVVQAVPCSRAYTILQNHWKSLIS